MKLQTALGMSILMMLLLTVSSCASDETWPVEAERRFLEQYPVEDLNESISLQPISGEQLGYEAGETIFLEIRNHSQNHVVFSNDFGVQGLVYSSVARVWDSISNDFTYSDRERILGAVGSDIPPVAVVHFHPAGPLASKLDVVRIVVRGNEFHREGDIGDPVMAYIDFWVNE